MIDYNAVTPQGSSTPTPVTGAPPRLGTPIPGTTGGLPTQQGLNVATNPMARELQTMGRGDDKMLVHMTPGEVGGLQQLALAHGGSLTINPHTGLPEAGFLSKILPTILGIAGAAFGIPTWAIGLGVGAGQTALTGDLGKGLSAGLQAFGGAGIGQAAGLGSSVSKDAFGLLGKGATSIPTPPPGMFSAPSVSGGPAAIPSAASGASKGFLGKFADATSLGQKGMIGKALPMMAGSAVLGGVSDAMQPKMPTYNPDEEGKSTYEGPYVPGKRDVQFQPYEQMKQTGGAEAKYFTPSNPVPGFRPVSSLDEEERAEYGYADGGIAQLPTPQGFNELVSFFNSANPGAVTASMYPSSAAPASPAAPAVGAPGTTPPREQTYTFNNRPPTTTAPVPNSFSDIGYVDIPGVGNIMIPGFSGYDFGNIDFDAIARQQNYIPQAEQLVIREPDMTGIYDRFGSIENQLRNIPTPQAPDLSGIYDRFGQIENQLQNLPTPQAPDLTGIYDRFGSIENRLQNIPTTDLTGIYDRFGQIENRISGIPQYQEPDLTGIYDRFGQIENQLQNIPTTDLSGIYDRFGSIESQLQGIPQTPDLSGIYDRFGSIENRLQNMAPTDLTGVYDRFGQIENQLQNLPTPQAPDLTGVFDRFGQLESRINALPTPQATDLSGVYDRFGQLEGRLNSLPTPQAPDLSGIYDRFGQLEGRINALPTPQATDLTGVYDRFGQLESRINSLPTPQATDLSGIQSQIEALRGQYQPTDLSGIQSQIEALGGRISNLPTPQAPDLSGIYDRFGQLEGRISSLPTPQATDLSGIQSQIEALRGQYQPTDLSGIQSQIGQLQSQFSNMPAPQAPDLSGIYDRFGQLESQFGGLQNQISNLPAPQATDLSGIQSQLGALQTQFSNMPAPQATDLSGIQSQLQQLQELYSTLANPSNVTAPSISGGYTPSSLDTGGFYARGGEVDMSDGAFVVDARTVSELGNGSSNAGMDFLSRLGGRPLRGPGDGVSDSIPARIGGRQEARVARDEVIFQPDAVKRIGGGSEQRGTAKLYSLMDKAHKARKKAKRGEDTGLRKALA